VPYNISACRGAMDALVAEVIEGIRRRLASGRFEWRRKRDSFVRKPLILHKLLTVRFAQLAQLARKAQFWLL